MAVLTRRDREWLKEVEDIVVKEISSSLLSVRYLAQTVHLSEKTFLRKMKKLTGMRPIDFINDKRLTTAHRLMENEEVITVKEAALSVGFTKPSHFTSLYKQKFGELPSCFWGK